MKFMNPTNGFVEERSVPWLWMLLFGLFYAIACGLWRLAIIWLITAITLFWYLGPPATMFLIAIQISLSFAAKTLVSDSYLRKGWVVVTDKTEDPLNPNNESDDPELTKCPFCAEWVKVAAIKCKHCGSDLSAG